MNIQEHITQIETLQRTRDLAEKRGLDVKEVDAKIARAQRALDKAIANAGASDVVKKGPGFKIIREVDQKRKKEEEVPIDQTSLPPAINSEQSESINSSDDEEAEEQHESYRQTNVDADDDSEQVSDKTYKYAFEKRAPKFSESDIFYQENYKQIDRKLNGVDWSKKNDTPALWAFGQDVDTHFQLPMGQYENADGPMQVFFMPNPRVVENIMRSRIWRGYTSMRNVIEANRLLKYGAFFYVIRIYIKDRYHRSPFRKKAIRMSKLVQALIARNFDPLLPIRHARYHARVQKKMTNAIFQVVQQRMRYMQARIMAITEIIAKDIVSYVKDYISGGLKPKLKQSTLSSRTKKQKRDKTLYAKGIDEAMYETGQLHDAISYQLINIRGGSETLWKSDGDKPPVQSDTFNDTAKKYGYELNIEKRRRKQHKEQETLDSIDSIESRIYSLNIIIEKRKQKIKELSGNPKKNSAEIKRLQAENKRTQKAIVEYQKALKKLGVDVDIKEGPKKKRKISLTAKIAMKEKAQTAKLDNAGSTANIKASQDEKQIERKEGERVEIIEQVSQIIKKIGYGFQFQAEAFSDSESGYKEFLQEAGKLKEAIENDFEVKGGREILSQVKPELKRMYKKNFLLAISHIDRQLKLIQVKMKQNFTLLKDIQRLERKVSKDGMATAAQSRLNANPNSIVQKIMFKTGQSRNEIIEVAKRKYYTLLITKQKFREKYAMDPKFYDRDLKMYHPRGVEALKHELRVSREVLKEVGVLDMSYKFTDEKEGSMTNLLKFGTNNLL